MKDFKKYKVLNTVRRNAFNLLMLEADISMPAL